MNAVVQFKPAVRQQVSLIIGLAGGTGSGKTYSAMLVSTGLSGRQPFAVIDTEAGRALHYAPGPGATPDFKRTFLFQHEDLRAPFRPETYARKILELDAMGFPVIMVDSCSHEWAGDGGILEWHEEELQRMAGDDWKKREACKMAAWIKPKMSHKKMVSRLLQVRAHLVLCFRAEPKVEPVRDKDGKMQIVPKVTRTGLDGWVPICEKNLPFELTTSFLLTEDAPGMPKPIKLQEQHREFFPLNQPIGEKAGELMARWAHGDAGTAPSEADQLLDAYAKCTDEAGFAALEKRRTDFWKTSSPQKPKVKAASDVARKRLDEAKAAGADKGGESPNNATWIATLTGQTSSAELTPTWEECTEAYGGLVPLEVSDAYEAMRERLVEQEAKQQF